MSADFEIHDVHVGEVLFHDKAIVGYPHILFVDVGNLRQGFDPCGFTQRVYLGGIAFGVCKRPLGSRNKLIERYGLAVFGRGINMHDLRLVTGISDASAYLRKERGNIQQRVRLSSVADDECNAVGVEDVTPLEAGRGVKVYLLCRVGGLAYGIGIA